MTESLKARLKRFIKYSEALEEELKQLYREMRNADKRDGSDKEEQTENDS